MDFPIRIFRVADRSMEPGLRPGDYIFVNGLSKRVRMNDIVVMRHPSRKIYIVKRVGRIDGRRIYLLGDNARESEDSRKFGALKAGDLIGKLIFKL